MNSIDIIKDRAKQKKQKQFLLIANGVIVGILIVWLTVGNLLVAYLEQPILKAQSEFVQRYPKRAANASEIKLRGLISKLELDKELEPKKSIGSFFGDYVFDPLRTANNQIIPIPNNLKIYLTSKTIIINEIITLLKKESLKFEILDLSKALIDPLEYSLPSYLNLATLQRVLLVEAIQQYQSGKAQKVLDILNASWNLNLALQEQPLLIPQLVAQILYTDQLAFLRKTRLPIEVPQLVKPNYATSILPSIEFEISFIASFIKTPSSEISEQGGYAIFKRSPSLLEKLLLPFQLPYFKLSGIDYWERNMQMQAKIQKSDICLLDSQALQKETKPTLAWWNVSGRSQESILLQGIKPYRRLIEWEFTKKILKAKATAAKTGAFASAIRNTEYSTICKSLQYDYQVTDNGQKMTIQIQNPPKWFEYKEGNLLLTYSFTLNSIQPPR